MREFSISANKFSSVGKKNPKKKTITFSFNKFHLGEPRLVVTSSSSKENPKEADGGVTYIFITQMVQLMQTSSGESG